MWSISKETGPAVASNRERSSEGEESDDSEEQCRTRDILDIESKPNQPHPKFICVQTLPNKVLHFQGDWYIWYQWLHCSPTVKGTICIHCVKTYTIMKSTLSQKADPASSPEGFANWKNAHHRFECHQHSKVHHHAVTVSSQEAAPIESQLSSAWAKQQENARHYLESISDSVQYLAGQGLALREHGSK